MNSTTELITAAVTNQYWWPLALAGDIKTTSPKAIIFKQKPLVAFRSQDNQVHLLNDWCPHRFSPLSNGKIINGELQCPYHGWQFNGKGICTRVPGLNLTIGTSPLIQSYVTQEQSGLLWMAESINPDPINLPSPQQEALDSFFLQGEVQCDLIDLVENFLDGFHTHFIHARWIRKDQQRQTIQAIIKPLGDGLEVEYSGETVQNGFISRWLEGERGISYARFRLPNMAELEYRDAHNRLSLLVTLWATPSTEFHHKVFVQIATPRRFLPAKIKEFFLRIIFTKILQQDKKILEDCYQQKNVIAALNLQSKTPLDSGNDLLASLLRQLITIQKPLKFAPMHQAVEL